jgi:hypothetical protein
MVTIDFLMIMVNDGDYALHFLVPPLFSRYIATGAVAS